MCIRINYQLSWEQKDQKAYVNFPHVLTDGELLPFIRKNDFKHPLYKDFTTFFTSQFEYIVLNSDCIMEQSETSNNRPYITTVNIPPFNTNLLQENFDDDENVIHHQPTTPQQPSQITQDTTESLQDYENVIQHQPTTPQQSSHITQDTTELLHDTFVNPLDTSTITDSNALRIPIHDITDNTTKLFNQEDTSTLSKMNAIDTQPLQLHQMIQRNYDPPPLPSETSTHSTPQTSLQQGSSNTFQTREHTLTGSQFQTTTPSRQSSPTIQYIPAQSSISQITNTVLTIKHSSYQSYN